MTFPVCQICESDTWKIIFDGAIRDGAYGKAVNGKVARCDGCGVERLDEELCLKEEAYADQEYRQHLGQDHDIARHFAGHDDLARFTTNLVASSQLRSKTVADIGCGGGSLLDHVRGLPAEVVAVDPDVGFRASLESRGYHWYAKAKDAARDYAGRIDVAFAIQVIEHVSDPREFLSDIRPLLAPDGQLIVSTPNRADILMELLPDEFRSFFYRTQHRWYFDAVTLKTAAASAGFRTREVRFIHRYGMANSLLWLRDRKPPGRAVLPAIDREADSLWRTWLEASGRSDNLYLVLTPS